jgi:hypothetical protein
MGKSRRTFTSGVELVYGPAPTLEWEHGSDEFDLCVPFGDRITRCLPMKVKDIQVLIDLLEELSETHAREDWREANGLPPLAKGEG